MDTSQSGPAVSGVVVTTSRVLRLAVAAYLVRFKGQSRVHTESDLRGYLIWCEERELDPFAATRPHIELYVGGNEPQADARQGESLHRFLHLRGSRSSVGRYG